MGMRVRGSKSLVDRRKDPDYEQVTGHVQKDLARRFKVFCTEHRITIAEGLDQAIALFLKSELEEGKPKSQARDKGK
jgi:DNA-binding transcriptional MocR family regulator